MFPSPDGRSAPSEPHLVARTVLSGLALALMLASVFWVDKSSSMRLVQLAIACFAFFAIAAKFWRHRRAQRDQELIGRPGDGSDNRPIVPR